MGAIYSKQVEEEQADRFNGIDHDKAMNVDDLSGCRKFQRLPPIGQHPRLFFTADELPLLTRKFMKETPMKQYMFDVLNGARVNFLHRLDLDNFPNVSTSEKEIPTLRSTVDTFFVPNETRNINLLCTYVYGVLYNDAECITKARRYALFHARVILKARELAHEFGICDRPYHFWHSDAWTVPFQFLVGGSAYALLYDLMYNELSDEERRLIKQAITAVLENRRPWGIDFPSRRIQSNWAAYHGDFYTLSAVVEDGINQSITQGMNRYADLMVNLMNFGVYSSGHPVEDSYMVNLALREGSLCFLAMARRGFNIFNHPSMLVMFPSSSKEGVWDATEDLATLPPI